MCDDTDAEPPRLGSGYMGKWLVLWWRLRLALWRWQSDRLDPFLRVSPFSLMALVLTC